MPRIQESFPRFDQQRGCTMGDIIVVAIVLLSALSIGMQTFAVVGSSDQEAERKSLMCLKEYKDQDCNAFNPSEKCKPIVDCIKAVNEPFWAEITDVAFTSFQQLEKLSIVPLIIIGLVILGRRN